MGKTMGALLSPAARSREGWEPAGLGPGPSRVNEFLVDGQKSMDQVTG
jgi:hypothetical protein